MPYVDGDFNEKIWIDGFGDVAGDDHDDYTDTGDIQRRVQTENTEDRNVVTSGGRTTGQSSGATNTAGDVAQSDWASGQATGANVTSSDPSILERAAKLFNTTPDRVTQGMIGALLGAGAGYLLSKEPQTIQSRGIKSLPYTPNLATATRAVGTGGRGSVRHFNRPGESTQTQLGYSPHVYGPTGIEYLSSDTARAAGVNNFTLYRPTGVAPPPGTTGNPNLVNQAYFSLFGRSADPQGLAFFTQGLDTGQINQQNLLENIRRGAQGTDRDLLARRGFAAGGQTPTGLGYLKSSEDGMADRIPATIDGRQPAKLSGGEFVIPADVVSHLGNGNSDAGAKQLHDFMARIRKARTGNQEQGKRIDPAKFFPKSKG